MAALSAWVTALAAAHPVLFACVVIPVVSAVVNALIAYLASPHWASILAAHPRAAAAMKLLKAIGVDPVGILKSLHVIVTGRPPGGGDGADAGGDKPSKPKADAAGPILRSPLRFVSTFAVLGGMAAALAPLPACSYFQKGPKAVAGDVCQAIDAAKDACAVITYLGPDGKPRTVRVSQAELNDFGMAMSQRRELEKHPSAPALLGDAGGDAP